MKRGLFLAHNRPSASNTHFPLEVLKAAYDRLQTGIDSDEVLFCHRRKGQEAHHQFCPTKDLLTLNLPREIGGGNIPPPTLSGNTTLKLWQLIKVGYDRTRYIPTAYLCENGYIFVVLLDTHKLFVQKG